MKFLILILWKITILFSEMIILIYIPTINKIPFSPLQCQNLLFFQFYYSFILFFDFFMIAIISKIGWHSSIILICISLQAKMWCWISFLVFVGHLYIFWELFMHFTLSFHDSAFYFEQSNFLSSLFIIYISPLS